MSLIQEALKRQKEEAEQAQVALKVKTGAPTPPPRAAVPMSAPLQVAPIPPRAGPSAPPPLPSIPQPVPILPQRAEPAAEEAPPPAEIEPQEQKKALSKLAIVLVLILLLIVGGIILAYLGWTKMRASLAAKAQTALLPAVTQMLATAGHTVTTTAQAVATQHIAAATGTQTPTVAPQPVSTQTVAVAQPPAQAATQQVATVQTPPAPPPAQPVAQTNVAAVPAPPPTPAAVKASLTWPPMKLTAIIGKGKKGTARLNGQLLVVGEEIDGVRLVELSEYGVVIEYKGERQNLKLGGSLP
jgi:hypothetical protein